MNCCTCKGWSSCLSCTLDVFRCSWLSCWNSCYNCWGVTCIWSNSWSLTSFICNCRSCLNSYTFSSSDKVFFRCEGNRSCSRINCISSFTCYCHTCFICWLTCYRVNQFLACNLSSLIITQSKCRSLCLRDILNVFRNFICWSKSDWIYSWCISCRGFGSVLIFTNNSYSWCCTSEAWVWNKSYSSVCCYCVCTNAIDCLRSRSVIKGCWNGIVHWHAAVAFSEDWFARLSCPLNTWRFSWCRCWSYWSNSWRVSCSCWRTILINTFHGYAFRCSNISRKWLEGNCSVWCYSVSTNTIDRLGSWTIVKSCRNGIVHRYTAIAFSKDWLTSLSSSLDICRCCRFSSRYHRRNLRCVSCLYCCTICISCLHFRRNYVTWIRFIRWCEGHYTCFFINGVGTNNITCWWFGIYWSSWLTIFIKKGNRILVDWRNWITFCEGYCTRLNQTLRTSRFSWSCCWSYWCNRWCVGCRSLGSVHIFTHNSHCWGFAGEWFFWNEGYSSVWSDCVGTNVWNCFSCCTIIKGCWNIVVHWHTTITFSKFRLTCLSLTLLTSRSCWLCSWLNWCNRWCVSCRSFGSVHVFTDNSHRWCSSDKWFFWNESYCSVCCYCVSTYVWNCLSFCTIVKCRWYSFIDGYCLINAINGYCSTLEFRFACLCGTLDISWLSWCCGWTYWNDFWCVSCINFNTIWTFSLDLSRCHSTCVWFISRCEGYLASRWINWEVTNHGCTVCCISWSCNSYFITIFIQEFVAIVLNSNSLVLTVDLDSCACKGWSTCLCGTLNILRFSRLSCWNSCYNCWCVCSVRCDRCGLTVFISNGCSCLNGHALSSSDKVFFWSKCNCSSRWVDSISTFSRYSYSCIISRLTSCWIHQFLACNLSCLVTAQGKSWCFCLWNVLNVLRYFISWCYSYWINCRRISCWSFSTVHIFTHNSHCWCCTSEAWFWNKGYRTIRRYCVSTDAVNCLSFWSIVKGCRNSIIHRYTAISSSKFRFTGLCSSLNVFWNCWCSTWYYWCNCRCVLSCYSRTILIDTFHSHAFRCTNICW